jgi:lipopolysaccharide/colanic/teichoic acid biosynthesis glycosyltransferase
MLQRLRYNMHMVNAVKTTLTMAHLSSLNGRSTHTDVRASRLSGILQYGFAAVSLLLLAPLFLIISLLIKLTSRGPVFYRGLGVGKDGRIVTLYQFSTFDVGADEKIGAYSLAAQGASYTHVGKVLKYTKLDRLPRLVNVLKGDMHFVGPRPARPIFLAKPRRATPRYSACLTVKPGMTEITHVGARGIPNPRLPLSDSPVL